MHAILSHVLTSKNLCNKQAIHVQLMHDFCTLHIIFSDSLSVLKAMNHTSSKNIYKEIVLFWIPSHIGIQGNEMVDKQAKTSLSLEPTSFKIPFSNFKPSINKFILEEWQTSWNNSIGNKLLYIKPTIGEYQSVVRNI